MHYMLLIYTPEEYWANRSDEDRAAMSQEYFAVTQAMRDAGAFVAGDALQPIATATTVRVSAGDALTTDGPFAETKEQLGGYYLLDVESLDEALEWAAKIPAARHGSVEVRPVMNVTAGAQG
jgi:hypothetical protein